MIVYQFNLARMREPFDAPLFEDFRAMLDETHDSAARCPDFHWRYKGDPYIRPYPNPLIMGNLSGWHSLQGLKDFTFSGAHLRLMQMKRKWFEPMPKPYNVLWLANPGGAEIWYARLKLAILREFGSAKTTFDWTHVPAGVE